MFSNNRDKHNANFHLIVFWDSRHVQQSKYAVVQEESDFQVNKLKKHRARGEKIEKPT